MKTADYTQSVTGTPLFELTLNPHEAFVIMSLLNTCRANECKKFKQLTDFVYGQDAECDEDELQKKDLFKQECRKLIDDNLVFDVYWKMSDFAQFWLSSNNGLKPKSIKE